MITSKKFVFAVAASLSFCAIAEDLGRNFQVSSRARVEYDDNIYDREDAVESLKLMEELEFSANVNLQQSFIGARYRPSFVWWENRDSDSSDVYHDLEISLNHSFTPRLGIALKELYRMADQPELIDRGVVVQQLNDFAYNVADAALNYSLRPDTRIELLGRNTMLRYSDDDVAATQDYDINSAGLTVRHEFDPKIALAVDARLEATSYELDERSADSQYYGAGIDRIFSPSFLGSIRAGGQFKQFESDDISDESAPYVDASVTLLPSPRTRVMMGLGYSLFESDFLPYANQERTLIFASVAHDLTARIALYLAGNYQMGEYDADQAIPTNPVAGAPAAVDAEESVASVSLRSNYKINRSNSIDFSLQHTRVDGELPGREDFDRNRVSLGWRTQI